MGAESQGAKRTDIYGDALVFAIPTLLAAELSLGGRLFLPELILMALLPVFLLQAQRRQGARIPTKVVVLGLVWLSGQVISDIAQLTALADYSRGWAKIFFLLVNLVVLALLIDGHWRRVWLFGAGLAIGGLVQFYINPSVYAGGNPWKFGVGQPITLIAILMVSRQAVFQRVYMAPSIIFALATVNLVLGFRSLAGVCFVAGVIAVLAQSRRLHAGASLGTGQLLRGLIVIAIAGLIFVGIYGYAAGHGLLGSSAAKKYESENSSFGVLGGRPEILVSTQAISESPVIGYGSWAKEPKYAVALAELHRRSRLDAAGYPVRSELIPTHSHLFGAWVEAGIAGAVFWIWLVIFVLRILPRIHLLADERVPLVAFIAVLFLWDIFFSPFGAERRLIVPFYVIALWLAQESLRRRAGAGACRNAQ